jgi:hypothetical protein
MKSRPVILVATLLLASLGGCDSYGPDDDDENDPDNPYAVEGHIRTGDDTYVFVLNSAAPRHYKSIVIDYSIRNYGPGNLYMTRCMADPTPVLLKLQEREWIVALEPLCYAAMNIVTIPPFSTFRASAELRSYIGYNVGPQFNPKMDGVPGTYKFLVNLYEDYGLDFDSRRQADMTFRLSNEFKVVEAP